MGPEDVFGSSVPQRVRSPGAKRSTNDLFGIYIGRLQRPVSLFDRFPRVSRNAQPQALISVAVGDKKLPAQLIFERKYASGSFLTAMVQ